MAGWLSTMRASKHHAAERPPLSASNMHKETHKELAAKGSDGPHDGGGCLGAATTRQQAQGTQVQHRQQGVAHQEGDHGGGHVAN